VGCHHFTVVGVLGHHDHRMVRERVPGVPERGLEEQWVANAGRRLRRLAEREAKRRDGKQRNSVSDQRGKLIAVYRSGRTQSAGDCGTGGR